MQPTAGASPGSLDRQLAAFRAAHPPVRLQHAGHRWTYLRGGSGAEAVLSLTGALGIAELAFQQISALEREFRVLAPDYPPAGSIGELVEGAVAILDAEGVKAAHVTGGSFGGMVAQELVRRHPDRVRSLVLSHTAPPRPGKGGRWIPRLMAALPMPLLRRLVSAKLRGTFQGADPFWERWFDEVIGRVSKAGLLSRVRVAAEFAEMRYGPGDLAAWPGRMLIVDSDADPMFTREGQGSLRALYPTAAVHTFRGTGHSAAILQPDAYAAVIRGFLTG
jgi:pimeloyl-ACP methyl ester carboxylesterase